MGRTARSRSGCLVTMAAALVLVGPPVHASAQATVTVGEDATLETAEDGTSTLTVTLTVTGVDAPTAMTVTIGDGEGADCTPLNVPIVRPGVSTKVEIDLPATCEVDGPTAVALTTAALEPGTADASGVSITVDAEPAASSSPDFDVIGWGFGAGATLAIATVAAAWVARVGRDDQSGVRRWPSNPWTRLPGLGAKWSWTDSPLSSITVGAAVFTAVLGANEPLEAIVGDAGEDRVAVVVVAAALATALTGAAPLALALFRKEDPDYPSGTVPNNYTGLGVLVATATVAAGSLGLILSVALTLWGGDAVDRWVLGTSVAVVGALVIAYTARSIRRTLKIGVIDPDQLPSGVEMAAMP